MLSIVIPNHNEKDVDSFVKEIHRILPVKAEVIVSNDLDGKGKGWAVRQGLSLAVGGCVAFIDGDGDIAPRMLKRLLPFIEDFDIVVGSKSNSNAPLHRKIITHLSRIYIRMMFGLSMDTQTGIKIYRREVLENWITDGFLYDVEILAKAKRRGYNIIEVPIHAEITSSMSRGVLWRTLKESLKIWLRSSFRAGR